MSEHQRETAFLRQCLLYADTAERDDLVASMTSLQRDERCVRRAVLLMVLLTALSVGVCCAAFFLADSPQKAQLITPFIGKVFCALGVGSLICMLAFAGLGAVYRQELDHRREECRRLATKLFESHPEKPRASFTGVVKEQELIVNHSSKAVGAGIGNRDAAQRVEEATISWLWRTRGSGSGRELVRRTSRQ
jgi:Tfp pilus assembly protein PilN